MRHMPEKETKFCRINCSNPYRRSADTAAFYAGWPNVFSAIPVAKGVFEKRPRERDSR
jgi:hypothetical protein